MRLNAEQKDTSAPLTWLDIQVIYILKNRHANVGKIKLKYIMHTHQTVHQTVIKLLLAK